MPDIIDIDQLKSKLEAFSKERDWNQYHNPKNLSMALACEAGELLEIFRWMTETDSLQVFKDAKLKEQVAHELADIILNAVRIADFVKVNLSEAVTNKLKINAEKYPTELVKGDCKKYTEYT